MWDKVGMARNEKGLKKLLKKFRKLEKISGRMLKLPGTEMS